MKTYKVKNYKGNLVESLMKFQKKHPNSKITSVYESDGKLKIRTDEEDSFDLNKWAADKLTIVINNRYGKFEIPEKFIKETGIECDDKYTISNPQAPNVKCPAYEKAIKRGDEEFKTRCDPRLVKWVKENALVSDDIALVFIPKNATDIKIDNYDSAESVLYVVNGKTERAS